MLSFTELKVNPPKKIPFCSAAEEHCGLPNPGSLSHHNRKKVFVLLWLLLFSVFSFIRKAKGHLQVKILLFKEIFCVYTEISFCQKRIKYILVRL